MMCCRGMGQQLLSDAMCHVFVVAPDMHVLLAFAPLLSDVHHKAPGTAPSLSISL